MALESHSIPYAIVGGNAVAAWVSTIDPGAVRNTVDVDMLVNRANLEQVKLAMTEAGFLFASVLDVDMFIDGPDGRARDAVHLVYAEEPVKVGDSFRHPAVEQSSRITDKNIVTLETLVRMKLVANRRKDQVHLLDMLEVGLIDATWVERLESPLAERLQTLIDDPLG